MSQVLKIIKERRSIRRYLKKEIPDDAVEKLKEALVWAPSAGNCQARKFYFVFNNVLKQAIVDKASRNHQQFISQAPLVIVACADLAKLTRFAERGENMYSITDVSSSIQNAMLVATELGLGSCWIGSFDENEIKKILALPPNLRPLVVLPVGYPGEAPVSQRVSASEAVEIRR